jgi:hypothetical protein
VDMGTLGDRTFVDNASFGAYAEVVKSPSTGTASGTRSTVRTACSPDALVRLARPKVPPEVPDRL